MVLVWTNAAAIPMDNTMSLVEVFALLGGCHGGSWRASGDLFCRQNGVSILYVNEYIQIVSASEAIPLVVPSCQCPFSSVRLMPLSRMCWRWDRFLTISL